MGEFTYYLTVREDSLAQFTVKIDPETPMSAFQDAMARSADLRYSPILPAYLAPDVKPQRPPTFPSRIAFFFAARPYQSLGKIRPDLSQSERDSVFFTEGLASIIMLDCTLDRARRLKAEIGCSVLECWEIDQGVLRPSNIVLDQVAAPNAEDKNPLVLTAVGDPQLDVYVEQISASIASLWASFAVYFPDERATLNRVVKLTKTLIDRHIQIAKSPATITRLQQSNAIISALVEISASLSYSVTQGTSGASPILSNRSPFPHHSLLGVGGAIRALTKFTRYLEAAFKNRDAAQIIEKQYSTKNVTVPVHISKYESGASYLLKLESGAKEEFD